MKKLVPNDAILMPDQAKKVFTGEIFDVYQWPQPLFDGSSATFEMLRRPDTVLMICIKGDKIIFIREQQPSRPEYVRLPGGRVDPGEEWDTAVKRECKEELGLEFGSWRLVQVCQPVAKIEWFVATYLATDCTFEGEMSHDPGEKISLVPMSFAEAKEHVASTTDPLNDYTRTLFDSVETFEELKALPAFTGQTIDRETDD
jgi:ADP-ribose pyrophosphatase YjhB (NUDIX family)